MNRRNAIIRRILERVVMVPNAALGTPCWEYQGADSGKGYKGKRKGRGHSYGRMSLDGQTVAVHIVMWVCHHGYLPSKKQLDHLCTNRKCCNPAHMEPMNHKTHQRRHAKLRLLAPGETSIMADGSEWLL